MGDTVNVTRLNFDDHADLPFLEAMYQAIYRRGLDREAMRNYLRVLPEGYPREQVVSDMLNSDEFRNWSTSWFCSGKAREFINENTRFWREREKAGILRNRSRRYIVVSMCHPDPTFVVRNGFIAKYLQDRYGCRLMALVANDRLLNTYVRLARSFGMDDLFLLESEYPDDFAGELPVLVGNDNTRENLLSLTFDGILVGDLVYDSYLRTERVGTVKGIDEALERQYAYARNVYDEYCALFERCGNDVLATVQDHIVYIQGGILARMAHARGAIVFSNHGRSSPLILKKIEPSDDIRNFELKFSADSFRQVRGRLSESQVKAGREIVKRYYVDQEPHQHTLIRNGDHRRYTRKELEERLRLAPGRPIVFILSHLMCDAPHQQGEILYEDYYQWLVATLEIVKDVPEVNWIVKPHPYDGRFTDRFTALTAVEPFEPRYEHIRVCPSDLHPGSLVDVADALVTARGTAGLEAATFGIPCVLAGDSPYRGHGFSLDPKTPAEYADALRALSAPAPLPPEAVRQAGAYAYLFFELARVPCAFLPPMPYVSLTNLPDAEQWAYMADRLRDTRVEDDPLHRNLSIQLETGFPHLLMFDRLGRAGTEGASDAPEIRGARERLAGTGE